MLRKAIKDDIEQIDKCNRRNLPENYTSEDYNTLFNSDQLFSNVLVTDDQITGYIKYPVKNIVVSQKYPNQIKAF